MNLRREPRGTLFGLLFLFLILASGISVAGYRYYQGQKREVELRAREGLAAIANLKVGEIAAWRRERIGDAEVAVRSSIIIPSIRRLLEGRATAAETEGILAWMKALRENSQYANVSLLDSKGAVRLAVVPGMRPGAHSRALVSEVMSTRKVIFADLHRAEGSGLIHMSVVIPVLAAGRDPVPVGALLLWIDPNSFLYPLVQTWPTTGRSGETLLVRREGNEVVYLNELRHQKGTALKLRRPLANKRMVAAMAVSGREELVEGMDYRGVPVLAATRRIPDSPWFLVAKVDAEEVYAVIRSRSQSVALVVGLLVAVAGAGVGMLWRHQQARFYRQCYQAELERRALIGHYDYLSRYANDIILLADEQDRIVEANERAVTSYGYSRDELLRLTVRDLRAPSSLAEFENYWKELGERQEMIFKVAHRRKDGSTFPAEISARVIEVDGRKFRQGIIRDITERERAEEARRESEQRFRLLVENAPDAIYVQTQRRFAYLNAEALKLFGAASVDELLDRPVMDRFHPDFQARVAERIRLLNEEKKAVPRLEQQYLKLDGTAIDVDVSAVPIRYDNHDGALVFVRDITERRQIEQQLRQSEERYRAIVEDQVDLVGRFLPDGRLTFVNEATCRCFGRTREELLGCGAISLTYPEDRLKFQSVVASLGPANSAMLVEGRVLAAGGSVLWMEWTIRGIFNDEGRLIEIQGVGRDITKQKQAENALLQAQKMEAVGRLAGGVAHDFNNLLMIITGYTDLLLEKLDSADERRPAAEEVRRAAGRAASLTRQLLAFSRKQILQPQVLDLNVVVTNIEKMLRRLIGEDIALITRLSPDVGQVKADPGQIEQVIVNLAVNARDAMPRGGKLIIETADTSVDVTRSDMLPGQYVTLAVSDTGCGMDAQTQAHVFEPFFTTKEKGKGTGLGLATVYGIIKQSDGYIWVSSEVRQGTTFSIYLPRLERVVEATRLSAGRVALPGGTETILLAEDEAGVRELISDSLRRRGYTLLEAGDGDAAVQIAEKYAGTIHLLITDVVMPGLSGRELAERLSVARPEMKALYISGYTDDALGRHGVLEAGIAFLNKPFTAADLARKVREVIDVRTEAQGA